MNMKTCVICKGKGYIDDLEQDISKTEKRIVELEAELVMSKTKCLWVNVYSLGRGYGGPEEGGWWFPYGDPIESEMFHSREAAEDDSERLMSEYEREIERGLVEVLIEEQPAESWPRSRPRYE